MARDELPGEVASLDLEAMMREALVEAEKAGLAGEAPIGALLVIDGRIVSRGRASHERHRSQIRHAELQALLKGGEALWEHHDRAVLFTTVEPCPLCLGASVMADVPHIVFAARDDLAGAGQIVEAIPYVRRHIRTYLGGVLEEESESLIRRFKGDGSEALENPRLKKRTGHLAREVN